MVVAMDEGAVYGSPMYKVIDDAVNTGAPQTDDSENDYAVDAATAIEQQGTPSSCRKKHFDTCSGIERQMYIHPA